LTKTKWYGESIHFKINVLLKLAGYVRRIPQVCFVCEHAVKFNKSNTTPRSRVITLNVVFNISAHAQRNIGIKKKYNLEIETADRPTFACLARELLHNPLVDSLALRRFLNNSMADALQPRYFGDAPPIFGRFCVTSVDGMGCDSRLLSFLLIDDMAWIFRSHARL
jgi:hypothetical protein